MKRKNEAWGIEVGSSAIKAMKLERHGSEASLVDYEIIKFKQVLTTPDLDADEQVQLGLDKLLQKHEDIGNSQTVVSVPGHLAFARFAKLPPVEPKKIPEIVRFEAIQQIPFPIEQVEWDYQVFQQADSPDVGVGIFAITKERVGNFLANYRTVNMDIDALTLSSLAVYNAYAYDNAKSDSDAGGVIYLDVGTVCTDVIIVEEGVIWSRTLPIGGNHFTEALVKAFKISFTKAEKLKREAGTSKYAKQIFQAMRGVFGELVQEIQRSLGYYQSLNRDANLTRIVAMGSTIKLPGLQKYLKQQLQMEVSRPDGFERIEMEGKRASDFAAGALNLGTAYGLALQGLGMEQVNANVLPSHIIHTRMWRAKQPWIAAAAACVVVAAGLTVARYYSDYSTWQTDLAQSQEVVNPIINRAEQAQSQYQQIEANSDPRQRIMNVRAILDYRDVLPKIMEDINLALESLSLGQPAPAETEGEAPEELRGQRRELHIDTVTVQYIPVPDNSNNGSNRGSNSRPGMPGGQTGDNSGVLGQTYALDTFFKKNQAPQFRITIEGTTPYQDAAALLNNEFVGWLRNNADRKTRPYVFKVSDEPVPMLDEVGRTRDSESDRRGSRSRGVRNRGAGYNPASGRGRGRGRVPDQSSRSNQGTNEPMTMDRLLPTKPESVRVHPQDKRFRVEWIVQLRSPKAARAVESPQGPQQENQEQPPSQQAANPDRQQNQSESDQADSPALSQAGQGR